MHSYRHLSSRVARLSFISGQPIQYNPSMSILYITYMYDKSQLNVGKYTSLMDAMG